MGLTEFFAMEASDYLERLDALVSPPTPPNADELVRLTRALRGSALMAKQNTIAAAAAAFERFARRAKESRVWDEATRQRAVRAVDDFKILIRHVGNWTDVEDRRARALTLDLDPDGEGATAPQVPPRGEGLDAGSRAFIGREGAAVASALDQAAKALQQDPRNRDPLVRVVTVMQPLRGLAVLGELPPMPELLEGIQRATAEVLAREEAPRDAALLLDGAAKALARAARELATEGKADPESPETRKFAGGLAQLIGSRNVVSIETLYYPDDGPHIVERGSAVARRRVLGQVELVSHGEHLLQAAHDLERAWSRTQVELRAQSLIATFRALGSAGGGPIADAVANFATAARDAVARGMPVKHTEGFVARLRDAGSILAETAAGEGEAELADRLRQVASGLGPAAPPAPPTPTAAPEPAVVVDAAPPVAPAPPAQRPSRSPFMIADAPPEPSPEPAIDRPTETAPPEDAGEDAGLVGSWARFQRYAEALGLEGPSLDELLAGPPADPLRSVIPTPTPVTAPPPTAAPDVTAPPITDYCYRGRAALARAASLRREIQTKLAAGATSDDLRDFIEELLDLVDLGLQD
jgi:hypothetical protein